MTPIDMHAAFKRDPNQLGSPKLVYSNLFNDAWEAANREPHFFRSFLRAEAESLDEEAYARDTAIGNLVVTGAQLQGARPLHKAEISKRFTQSSIELYGQPESLSTKRIALAQLQEFKTYANQEGVDQARVSRIIDFLEPQIGNPEGLEAKTEDFEHELGIIKQVIVRRYGDIINSLQKEGETLTTKIPANEVAHRLQELIDKLAQSDTAWEGWTIDQIF